MIFGKTEKEAPRERYEFKKQVKQDHGPARLAPRRQKPGVVKERDTLTNWLTRWGWNVNEEGQSYYNASYPRGDVHISLPMRPADSTAEITASSARGAWVGRAVHITFSDFDNGSKNNPRVWYNAGGWSRSKKPAAEENWLLTITSELTTAAGFEGMITL